MVRRHGFGCGRGSRGPQVGDVQGFALGLTHACAVDVDVGLKCWGQNDRYQVGIEAPTRVYEPSSVAWSGSVYSLALGEAFIERLENPGPAADPFAGTILIASTFTEEQWRPSLAGMGNRVRTVGPGEVDQTPSERGVVYQFSYLTLIRGLNCRNERGIDALWACWSGPYPPDKGANWADVEFTRDGDSVVTSLRLLDATDD